MGTEKLNLEYISPLLEKVVFSYTVSMNLKFA